MEKNPSGPAKIQNDLLNRIRRGRPFSEADFNRLALATYARQKSLNPVYRRFCESILADGTASASEPKRPAGKTAVQRWQDIPALPVSAFKYHRVAAFPPSKTVRTFLTSGTTRGTLRGQHAFETLALYDATVRASFGAHLFPAGASGPKRTGSSGPRRMEIIFLTAPSREKPESSLSYMGERVQKEFGKKKPFFALGPNGVRSEALTARLLRACSERAPVLIYTTTFALADYLDFLASKKIRIPLPRGSRIMETGGYKGRRTQVARPTLVRQAQNFLGVPGSHVVNEYGMTELTSQFYDRSLASARHGAVNGAPKPIKSIPPWTRIQIIHPATGRPVPKGKRGLIRILDLANQGSCLAIQTEDEGRRVGGGFEVLGRLKGADLRGCSLTFEENSR